MAALRALKATMDEGRDATPEEARAISAYSGWGGAANAFAENQTGGWAEVSRELKELLSEDEFAEQRATVLTAFYTPPSCRGAHLGDAKGCRYLR